MPSDEDEYTPVYLIGGPFNGHEVAIEEATEVIHYDGARYERGSTANGVTLYYHS